MYDEKIKEQIIFDFISNYKNSKSPKQNLKVAIKKKIKKDPDVERFISFHFSEGVEKVIVDFNHIINHTLDKTLNKSFSSLRTNEKICELILLRLNNLSRFKNGLKNLNKFLIKDLKIILINKLLFKIADQLWYLAGDKSTDFNYYSKRIILMKVYLLSFNYWLRDNSEDFTKTRIFTENQIKNVLKFGLLKNNIKNFLKKRFIF